MYFRQDKQFYAGFDLDGVDSYRNISDILPDYGQIQIYLNPEYYSFEEEDLIKHFDPEETYLYIRVSGLHLNVHVHDCAYMYMYM